MIAYLDLPSGISGDMFLGCLVDAGWPIDQLRQIIQKLHLPESEWSVESKSVMKGPLRATLVDVHTTAQPHTHHHHEHADHHHDHEHEHAHEHKHEPKQPRPHRNLHDVRAIINAADLAAAVKEKSIAVFTRLASAEARVHGSTIEAVHFHEVGALDAIIDIVGCVAGLHALSISRLYCSPVPLGSGWITTDHGKLPLPAPATLELLAQAKAPTRPAPGDGELVTPTGAAILAELATFDQPPMRFERIALGAGQKDFPWPNIARLWLGTQTTPSSDPTPQTAPLVQLETNIDDMNPQLYAAVTDRLFAAGARDVWLTPIQMKKGRPAVILSVLADSNLEKPLADLILIETTTLGLRVTPVHRHEARREMKTIQTPHGPVQVKLKYLADTLVGYTPEYEDCRRLADSLNLPLRTVYDSALATAHATFSSKKD